MRPPATDAPSCETFRSSLPLRAADPHVTNTNRYVAIISANTCTYYSKLFIMHVGLKVFFLYIYIHVHIYIYIYNIFIFLVEIYIPWWENPVGNFCAKVGRGWVCEIEGFLEKQPHHGLSGWDLDPLWPFLWAEIKKQSIEYEWGYWRREMARFICWRGDIFIVEGSLNYMGWVDLIRTYELTLS